MRTILKECFSWKWLGFIVVAFISFIISKFRLLYIANIHYLEINAWDLVIENIFDINLVYYFILPISMFHTLLIINTNFNSLVLIRTSSFTSWVVHSAKVKSFFLVVLLGYWIIVSFMLSKDLNWSIKWSEYAEIEFVTGNYSNLLYSLGLNVIVIVFLQLCLYYIFFMVLHVIISALHVIIQKPAVLYIATIFLYIYILVSYRYFDESLIWFKVNNFLFIYPAYINWSSPVLPYLILLVVIVFSLITVYLVKSTKVSTLLIGIKNKYNISFCLYLLIISFGIVSFNLDDAYGATTVADFFYMRFYGNSEFGTSMISFLYYSCVSFGLAYLFQLDFMRNENNMYYEVIRYGKYNSWLTKKLLKYSITIWLIHTYLLILLITTAYFKQIPLNLTLHMQSELNIGLLIYHYFVNGYLQVIGYIIVIFIVYWLFRNEAKTLLMLGVLLSLAYINGSMNMVMPLALNSFGAINNALDTYKITVILALSILVSFCFVNYIFAKRRD